MAGAAHAEEGGGHWLGLSLGVLVAIAFLAAIIYGFQQPFTPTYINPDFFFGKILIGLQSVVRFFIDYNVGTTIKISIGLIVIFLIGLNFYLFLRLLEMEDEHEDHVYHHAEDTVRPHSMLGHVLNEAKELGKDVTHTTVEKPLHLVDQAADTFNKIMYRDEADFVEPLTAKDRAPIGHSTPEKEGAYKWAMVLKHINSNNPSDWKMSLIEADTILDALVERSGFPGATLGERLKNADRGVFKTLDYALEAHKVRNRIAHEGSNFVLTERDAKKAISQYEEVFREFDYI